MIPSAEIPANDRPDVALTKPATPRRRWPSFSLRTMLVVITLTTIPLGIWINGVKRQERAVARLDAASETMHQATVGYDFEERDFRFFVGTYQRPIPQPEAKLGLKTYDYFHSIEYVLLSFHENNNYRTMNPKPNDHKTIQILRDLPHLTHLKIVTSETRKIDHAEIFEIAAQMKNLKNLWLRFPDNKLTGEQIARLKSLKNLEDLQLQLMTIETDADLSALAELQGLSHLSIFIGKNISPEGLKALRPLKNLQTLWLFSENELDKEHHEIISNSFPKLRLLAINNISHFDQLAPLNKHPSIKTLSVCTHKDYHEPGNVLTQRIWEAVPKIGNLSTHYDEIFRDRKD